LKRLEGRTTWQKNLALAVGAKRAEIAALKARVLTLEASIASLETQAQKGVADELGHALRATLAYLRAAHDACPTGFPVTFEAAYAARFEAVRLRTHVDTVEDAISAGWLTPAQPYHFGGKDLPGYLLTPLGLEQLGSMLNTPAKSKG
jgi:hypothetical protein